MKMRKLISENEIKSGMVSGIFLDDISAPGTIKVMIDYKVVAKFDADFLDDFISVLKKLKSQNGL